MQEFKFKPKGVCSRQMIFTIDNDTIHDLVVEGGCNGNSKGIVALLKGRKVSEIIEVLEGITCGVRKTSCPDQIATALRTFQGE